MRFDKPLKGMRPAALTRSGIPKIEIVKKTVALANGFKLCCFHVNQTLDVHSAI